MKRLRKIASDKFNSVEKIINYLEQYDPENTYNLFDKVKQFNEQDIDIFNGLNEKLYETIYALELTANKDYIIYTKSAKDAIISYETSSVQKFLQYTPDECFNYDAMVQYYIDNRNIFLTPNNYYVVI